MKFLLLDLSYEFLFSILFLFNSNNDLRVNILLSISIGVAGIVFELGLVLIYIISAVTRMYNKVAHIAIFSSFIIYVNTISFLYLREGRIIGLSFFVFILISSVASILVYYKIINSLTSESRG